MLLKRRLRNSGIPSCSLYFLNQIYLKIKGNTSQKDKIFQLSSNNY